MLRFLLFNSLYVGACGFALLRGAAPERLTAAAFIVAFQLSPLVISPLPTRYHHLETGVLLIDITLFIILYSLGCLTTRFWMLWMAGLQGGVLFSHFAGLAPRVIAWTASWATSAWSYPMLALLVVATSRHRLRIAKYGHDPAWRWQLPRNYSAGLPVDADRTEKG